MKNKVILIIALLLILISITAMLYPSISTTIVQSYCNNIIEEFNERKENLNRPSNLLKEDKSDETTDMSSDVGLNSYTSTSYIIEQDYAKLYEDSCSYNAELIEEQSMDIDFSLSALDLTKYGIWNNVYGYITVDSIGLELPIYLGSTDNNMSYGAVHLNGTSLPVGGEGTNCVIAGHTGFIGRLFFDNIKNLEAGNTVTIVNYFDTLVYEVETLQVIGKTDTDNLYIRPQEDRLVLMTCANGGSERLIVICRRKT